MGNPDLAVMAEKFVVVGVDGSEASSRAVDWAADEARYRSAKLRVVHANLLEHDVLESPLLENEARSEFAVIQVAVERARLRCPEVTVEARTVEPPAAESLIHASIGAELLVVGSRGLSRIQELLLGSVSRECVLSAQCSVLVVRG
jgi:nucleotide-binding universal stress UspA family protein